MHLTKDSVIFALIAAAGTIVTAGATIGGCVSRANDDNEQPASVEQVAFSKDVGTICSTWRDVVNPRTRHDHVRRRRELRRAKTSADQSVLLVEYHQLVASRYRGLLARFAALTPPDQDAARYRAASAAWMRAIRSYAEYRDALKSASTRRMILEVARRADTRRSAVERDAAVLASGLERLGAGECRLPSGSPLPVLRLPIPTSGSPPKQGGQTQPPVTLPVVDVAQPGLALSARDDVSFGLWVVLGLAGAGFAAFGVLGLIRTRRTDA
jgi:hypothetical protein